MAILPVGISGESQYQISRSLRFNSGDSAYMAWTPGSAGNRKTWTWSGWVKRSTLQSSGIQGLFGACDATFGNTNWVGLLNDSLSLSVEDGTYIIATSAVYRDVSSWYHFVFVFDSTQATASNRQKIYVNGTQITAFSTSIYVTQNLDGFINNNVEHAIGARVRPSGTRVSYFDGYMTEVNFIDGQALTPSSFGETDAQTGVWKPKKYTGTYGTNGFYLNFSDNSGTTSTTLGKDSSGNGNNWTPNNFSITAGAGNDSLVDVPTRYGTDTGAGGEVRGNYCTLNPLDSASPSLITNGNLQITANSDACGTMSFANGKWYFEVTRTDANAANLFHFGLLDSNHTAANRSTSSFTKGILYRGDGVILRAGSTLASGLATVTQNKVLGVAFDMDAKTVQFYVDNVAQSTAQTITDTDVMPWTLTSTNSASAFNAGQRPFAYTAPSGFKALCTQNLPTPTIGATSTTQANKYMDISLYSGNNSTQNVTNSGNMQPDMVWIKSRNVSGANHVLTDSVRGVNKVVLPNLTDAEYNIANTLISFNSNGFSLGNTAHDFNISGNNYVAWQWKAGGTAVTNTAGTITSTVRANPTAGFSIGTYTGSGSLATIGHGLGVAPKMIITKKRGATSNWGVYHASTGATGALFLNLIDAFTVSSGYFNNTAPTSSVFTAGGGVSWINDANSTYVFYAFSEVAGFSKFGSYTGNGSADGPFVYTGFRPRFIFGKDSGGTNNWFIFDTATNTYNVSGKFLRPNLPDAELDSPPRIDILSNGFKMRNVNLPNDPTTYIYAAFAETPFKYSLAR